MDKLTNPLQQALGDAQSLAVGRDHSMIEPAHLLSAFLNQSGGAIAPLLRKTGANLVGLKSSVIDTLDQVPVLADTTGDVKALRP
jgi:ATP-dependent Clp protease ATP-binding subunit ClpB